MSRSTTRRLTTRALLFGVVFAFIIGLITVLLPGLSYDVQANTSKSTDNGGDGDFVNGASDNGAAQITTTFESSPTPTPVPSPISSPTPTPTPSPTPPTPSPNPFKLHWQLCLNPECSPAHPLDPVQRQLLFSSDSPTTQVRPTVYVGRSLGFPVVEFPGPVEIINQNPPIVSYSDASATSSENTTRLAQFDLRSDFFLQYASSSATFTATPAAVLTKIGDNLIALPRATETPAWFKGYYYQVVLQDLPLSLPYRFGSPVISQGIATIYMANQTPPYFVYQYQASDINNDGQVNLIDFAYLRSELLKTKTYYDSDLNTDSKVDLQDFSLFVQHLRQYMSLMTTP